MSFLRINPSPDQVLKHRLAQYNQRPVGHRSDWWEAGFSVNKLVMKDYRYVTPEGIHHYISIKALGFAIRHDLRYKRRHLQPVQGEECFLIEQEALAMQAFIKRKHADDITQPSGFGMSRQALEAHFNAQ